MKFMRLLMFGTVTLMALVRRIQSNHFNSMRPRSSSPVLRGAGLLFFGPTTGNLDSATGEPIMMLLGETQQSLGMAIVMVTHQRQLAQRFADRHCRRSEWQID
jgi:ABC-type phosphonate transport system ATPase subunit